MFLPFRIASCFVIAGLSCLSVARDPFHSLFGFADATKQRRLDREFLKIPSSQSADQHLKILSAAPHLAGTKEDYETALYVARQFRENGFETSIVPYRVLLNEPQKVLVETFNRQGKLLLKGPLKEEVVGDPYQNDPRIVLPYSSGSASGDVTAEVVYANYGQPEDYKVLDALHISLKGKIVLVRYGANFRGVKAYIAEQRGAAGVLIFSDPADDGFARGTVYPEGPYRPETAVQRGSIQYMFKYPGDVETPGIASTPELPDSQRTPLARAEAQPKIMATPISYREAQPILQNMEGPLAPRAWQGALPVVYRIGPGGVKVHLSLQQNYQRKIIWNVIGVIRGSKYPSEWVIAGNHRDAWVYGAADPVSGSVVLLEAAKGIGALLKKGWRPERTIFFASWDAEEDGLIGSTEWVEQHAEELQHAVAYFNIDIGVTGPQFGAAATPSLKRFLEEIAREAPSPQQGSVYEAWRKEQQLYPRENATSEVEIGALGSGSDFAPFAHHLGIPATDIGSHGAYGVYHSAFDNYEWFRRYADPKRTYLRQMAQIFGLQVLHMADAPVLPYDYQTYAKEITHYLKEAQAKAPPSLETNQAFQNALDSAQGFAQQAALIERKQTAVPRRVEQLNQALRKVESDFLLPHGLPGRPWYRHAIFAPGEYTGYAAVALPGVNEAIEANDPRRLKEQLEQLNLCLQKATETLRVALITNR